MTTKTEVLHAGGFVLSEAEGSRSRDAGTLISGQNLGAGTVLGKISVGAATMAAKSGGNTGGGTGTIDATTPTLRGAKPGVYTARCRNLVANSGVFEVLDPSGRFVGLATGGVAFDKEVKFVIADVGTDFAIGDGFDITVPAGSGKRAILAPAALDGSAEFDSVLFDGVDASAADQPATLITRAVELNTNEITWPVGISDANKAIAVTQMLAAGIVLR